MIRKKGKSFKELCNDQIVIRIPFELRRSLEQKAKEKKISLSKLVRSYLEKSLLEELRA
jgi:predicted HicB family RNase H-like nuclease